MDNQSLREWMATEILTDATLLSAIRVADSILSHLREEIEKVENPYTVFDAQMCTKFELLHLGMKHQGFESAKQAIMKLLEV
jgi:predicted RNA-binding protein